MADVPLNPRILGESGALHRLFENGLPFSASVDPNSGDLLPHVITQRHGDGMVRVSFVKDGENWVMLFFKDWHKPEGMTPSGLKRLERAVTRFSEKGFLKSYLKNLIESNKVEARHLYMEYRDGQRFSRHLEIRLGKDRLGFLTTKGLSPTPPPAGSIPPSSSESPSPVAPDGINLQANANPRPVKNLPKSGSKSGSKLQLPSLREATEVKNPELLKRYDRVARRVFGTKYPHLKDLKNNGVIPESSSVVPEYRSSMEREIIENEALLAKYQQKKSALLKHHVRRHVQREARAAQKSFARYKASLTGQQKKDIARVRKLADLSLENSSLRNLLAELMALDLVISFTRGYYDGGWPALAEMLKSNLLLTAGITMTSMAVMSVPTGAEMLWAVSPYLGPLTQAAFLSLAIKGIGTNTAYLAVDYFLLDDNRKALVRTLYPEERVNVFDFWSFYEDVYGASLSPSTLYLIADRWQGFRNMDVNLSDDRQKALEILINRYRQWLLDNHPETRRLEYFKDDPQVWNALATAVFNDMRISLIIRELQESRKVNLAAMKGEEKVEFDAEPIDEEVVREAPVGGILGEIPIPQQVKKGESFPVDLECILYGFPREKIDFSLILILVNESGKTIAEKEIPRSLEISRERPFETVRISEEMACGIEGTYNLKIRMDHRAETIDLRQATIRIFADKTDRGGNMETLLALDELRELAARTDALSEEAARLCQEGNADLEDYSPSRKRQSPNALRAGKENRSPCRRSRASGAECPEPGNRTSSGGSHYYPHR